LTKRRYRQLGMRPRSFLFRHVERKDDNAASKEFTSAFEAEYKRTPSGYAATSYDAVRLLDSALTVDQGQLKTKKAFRSALEQAALSQCAAKFPVQYKSLSSTEFYLAKV